MTKTYIDPVKYDENAEYIYELGQPVIELLKPAKGEKILDLGCGTGRLAKQLVEIGCNVTGIDSDPVMIEASKKKGIKAILHDAENLDINEQFDGVITIGALQWMSDQYGVIRGVWKALRPGGRFAAECGGESCIRIIREGIKIALIKRNINYKNRNPWKYPETGIISDILETQGFKVEYIARISCPTPLKNGLRSWLKIFTEPHTKGLTYEEKETFYDDVEEYCKPFLYTEENGWVADQVRLRFLAIKPEQ